MTYPCCYVRLENIELLEEPDLTPYEDRLERLLSRVPTATHDQLTEIAKESGVHHFSKRGNQKIASRRAGLIRMLTAMQKNSRTALRQRAALKLFIGPMTDQMRNGHPY
jgi:hypothetical protein